jgi:hypothetical protein
MSGKFPSDMTDKTKLEVGDTILIGDGADGDKPKSVLVEDFRPIGTTVTRLALTLNNTTNRGFRFYDTDDSCYYEWDGTQWINVFALGAI